MSDVYQEFFKKIVKEYLHQPDPKKGSCLITGKVDLQQLPETFMIFMDHWCKGIDRLLQDEQVGSRRYIELVVSRGLTWEEYGLVFNSNINPEHFSLIKGFEFLQISSESDRSLFMASYQYSEESYLQLLTRKVPLINIFQDINTYHLVPQSKFRSGIITGTSGAGKSELIKLLFYSFVSHCVKPSNVPTGICLLDPHGTLAADCVRMQNIPADRLIYIDPSLAGNTGSAITINPFQLHDATPQEIDAASSEFCQTLTELLETDSKLSLPMQTLLFPCIHSLIAKGGSSIEDLILFYDDNQNEELVDQAKRSANPEIRRFFDHQFFDKTYQTSKSALLKRLSWLLQSDGIRSFLCGTSTLDFEEALNTGKIIICNLSSSKITTKVSSCIGRFLVSLAKLAAFKRAGLAGNKMPITYLIIDEFPTFYSSSESSKIILEQTRKFGLHLFASMQELGQVDQSLKNSLLNNCNLKIVGYGSNASMKEFGADVDVPVKVLKEMKEYHFCVKFGRYDPLIVKPPTALMTDYSSNRYYRTSTSMKEILIDQLVRYYRTWTYGQIETKPTLKQRLSTGNPDKSDNTNTNINTKNTQVDISSLNESSHANENSLGASDKQTQEADLTNQSEVAPAKPKYSW